MRSIAQRLLPEGHHHLVFDRGQDDGDMWLRGQKPFFLMATPASASRLRTVRSLTWSVAAMALSDLPARRARWLVRSGGRSCPGSGS